jgi:hypothetical protein
MTLPESPPSPRPAQRPAAAAGGGGWLAASHSDPSHLARRSGGGGGGGGSDAEPSPCGRRLRSGFAAACRRIRLSLDFGRSALDAAGKAAVDGPEAGAPARVGSTGGKGSGPAAEDFPAGVAGAGAIPPDGAALAALAAAKAEWQPAPAPSPMFTGGGACRVGGSSGGAQLGAVNPGQAGGEALRRFEAEQVVVPAQLPWLAVRPSYLEPGGPRAAESGSDSAAAAASAAAGCASPGGGAAADSGRGGRPRRRPPFECMFPGLRMSCKRLRGGGCGRWAEPGSDADDA